MIYRIRPSRLYRLPPAAGSAASPPAPAGPFTQASINGQHPPTQWL